jgi:hypothetical protein
VASAARPTPAAPIAVPACEADLIATAKEIAFAEVAALLKAVIDQNVADPVLRNRLHAGVDIDKAVASFVTAGEPATNTIAILQAARLAVSSGEAATRVVSGESRDAITFSASGLTGVGKVVEILLKVIPK